MTRLSVSNAYIHTVKVLDGVDEMQGTQNGDYSVWKSGNIEPLKAMFMETGMISKGYCYLR